MQSKKRAILRYDGKSFTDQLKAKKVTGWLWMRISYLNDKGWWMRNKYLKCWALGNDTLAIAFRSMLERSRIEVAEEMPVDNDSDDNSYKFWFGKSCALKCRDLISFAAAIKDLEKSGWEVVDDLPPRGNRIPHDRCALQALIRQIREDGVVIDGSNVIRQVGNMERKDKKLPSGALVLAALLDGLARDKIDWHRIYFDYTTLRGLGFDPSEYRDDEDIGVKIGRFLMDRRESMEIEEVQCLDLISKMCMTFPEDLVEIPIAYNEYDEIIPNPADPHILQDVCGQNTKRRERYIISNDNFDEYAEEYRWIDEDRTAILNLEIDEEATTLRNNTLGVEYLISHACDFSSRRLWGFCVPGRREELYLETIKDLIGTPTSFALVGIEKDMVIDWLVNAGEIACPIEECPIKEFLESYKVKPDGTFSVQFQNWMVQTIEGYMPEEKFHRFKPGDMASFWNALDMRCKDLPVNRPCFVLVVTGFEQCLKLDATDRSDFLSQLLLGLLNREEYSIQLILVSKIPLRWVEYATPIGDPTLSDKILVYEVPGSAVEVGDVKRVVPGLDDDVVQGIKTFVTSYYGGE